MPIDEVESSGGLAERLDAKCRSALHRYIDWQGRDLPSLAYEVCLYLADAYRRGDGKCITSTLAALSHWHKHNDFPDPTESPSVKDLVRQIRYRVSLVQPRLQPPPSLIEVMSLAEAYQRRFPVETSPEADSRKDSVKLTSPFALTAYRNRAILLIGFRFGLSTADVCRLTRSDVKITSNSLEITTSRVVGKRARYSFQIHRLPLLCPLAALEDWLRYSNDTNHYLFPRTTRRELPGSISSQAVQYNFLRVIVAPNKPAFYIRSLRYSLYFFLVENGWSRRKILKHMPFYKKSAATVRLRKPRQSSSNYRAPSTLCPEYVAAINSIFENSHYQEA
ncbi:hypothetical protein FQZ97_660770 [compost metagenome]